MAINMKEIIAEAALRLLFEKNKKKLTVRDIVEECQITRQAFYYHFADIPELLEWTVTQRIDKVFPDFDCSKDPEGQLKQMLLIFVNGRKQMEQGLSSNYGKELEEILSRQLFLFFKRVVIQDNPEVKEQEDKLDFFIRYHCGAIKELIAGWTDRDTERLEDIVSMVFAIISGQIREVYCK